jgi:two-component sensor histidine kinase
MVRALQGRLRALARAHELTLPDLTNGDARSNAPTTLGALLEAIFSPFVGDDDGDLRIVSTGPDIPISGHAVTTMALLLHEFATNAAKHGALSSSEGKIHVEWTTAADKLVLTWSETGGTTIEAAPESEGFGSVLAQGAMSQLGGRITRSWLPEGLTIRLTASLERLRA